MVFRSSSLLALGLLAVACQVKPYAPPPQAVEVESIETEVTEFSGRPEVYALVKGHLSTSAAQLVDTRQSRTERTLFVEVLEQTPRGASPMPDLGESPPFQTRIPVEILGLEPGPCLLNVNGFEVPFEIPLPRATLASAAPSGPVSPITLLDEFIPIEDAEPAASGNIAQ